jgi:hypothetical protein
VFPKVPINFGLHQQKFNVVQYNKFNTHTHTSRYTPVKLTSTMAAMYFFTVASSTLVSIPAVQSLKRGLLGGEFNSSALADRGSLVRDTSYSSSGVKRG